MSPIKEPHFFYQDSNYRVLAPTSLKSYERLFFDANGQHKAVGEASVWYLYSDRAVPSILDYAPNAKFIVCLRNPQEMAPSLHQQQVRSGYEHVEDFETAWRLQERRLIGEAVARSCLEPTHLAYGAVCSLGKQLDRLYRRVEKARVLTVLLDDISSDPRREYLRALEFLNLSDDGRVSFDARNQASAVRSRAFQRLLQIGARMKRRLKIYKTFGIAQRNLHEQPRHELGEHLKDELRMYFHQDIEMLSRLLGRELTW